MNCSIDVEYEEPSYAEVADEPSVRQWVEQVLAYQKIDGVELSVSFVSEASIATLNKEWRGKEGPTDILSFVQSDVRSATDFWPSGDDDGLRVLGDMVICLSVAKTNSEEFSVPFAQEIRRLLIHGTLHLLGYDHATNGAEEPMLELQERILADLGGK
ncbi:MAG: rRNA maturation RNase YbeY [Spirochaetia bacterium]|jgi:probable rRNA maturation factor|nr:rRNA maturation RNase YbeY [Spirochaetia bacterium]